MGFFYSCSRPGINGQSMQWFFSTASNRANYGVAGTQARSSGGPRCWRVQPRNPCRLRLRRVYNVGPSVPAAPVRPLLLALSAGYPVTPMGARWQCRACCSAFPRWLFFYAFRSVLLVRLRRLSARLPCCCCPVAGCCWFAWPVPFFAPGLCFLRFRCLCSCPVAVPWCCCLLCFFLCFCLSVGRGGSCCLCPALCCSCPVARCFSGPALVLLAWVCLSAWSRAFCFCWALLGWLWLGLVVGVCLFARARGAGARWLACWCLASCFLGPVAGVLGRLALGPAAAAGLALLAGGGFGSPFFCRSESGQTPPKRKSTQRTGQKQKTPGAPEAPRDDKQPFKKSAQTR